MDVAQLRQQHDVIQNLSAELAALVLSDVPQQVGALKWRLGRELIGHLAIEDRWFYPRVISHGTSECACLALAFKAEMGDLASEFTRYMADWTDQRIVSEWSAFGRATAVVLDALSRRIERENGQLYPICDFAPRRDLAS